MTLLDDLQAIDLSAILDAKVSIRVAVDTDDLRRLVTDGPATRVLGDLGAALTAVQDGIDDPSALLAPLVDGLEQLVGLLGLDDLPLADYLASVREGAEILAAVVGSLSGDIGALGPTGGATISGLLERAGGPVADFVGPTIATIGKFKTLIDAVEAGVPTDPSALADLAIDILLPFPRSALVQVRGQLDAALDGLASIELRPTLTSGLVAALGQVRVKAAAGDVAGLNSALAGLARLGDEAVTQLAGALRQAAQVVAGLRLDATLGVIAGASGALRTAERGALEELASWRVHLAEVRAFIETVDPAVGIAAFERILDLGEAAARNALTAGVDAQLERMKAWLRGLLRELPLRTLRGQLTAAILGAAQAVAGAGIDAVADEIRARVTQLTDLLATADLGQLVGEATQAVEDAVGQALDQVEAALGTITTRVDEVAGEAQGVLERVVEGLAAFRAVADEVGVALSPESIAASAQETIDGLAALRQQAEALLTVAPLPEPLRPVIEQLTATIAAIDLDAVIGAPLKAAAAQLRLPDEVGATVTGGLEAVADAVSSLVPSALLAELQAELDHVLDSIGDLDLAPLTAGLADVLDEAASFLEGVDVVGAAAPASAAFAKVLEVVDRAHPRRLLQPAIDAYDHLLGGLTLPDPGTLARRAAQVTAIAGEATARVAAQPLQKAAPSGASLAPATAGREAPGGAGPGAPAAPPGGAPVPPAGLRPGDVIRMVGFLPAALRDALATLAAGPAGQALAAIDRLCSGLAAELRRLRVEVVTVGARVESALDGALAPLAGAQVDAQLALRARFGAGSAVTVDIDLNAAITAVARVGPAALRARLGAELGLVRGRADSAAGALTGAVAAAIDDMAGALEGCLLADLAGDLDGFLAALDPEPIAAEFDAVVAAILDRTPDMLAAASAEILSLERRIRSLVAEFNPGTQAQRLLGILDVLAEEIDLLNPGRLADELGEVHAALRAAIAAYDPAVLAADVDNLLDTAATTIRGLDPAGLLPDLSGIRAQVERLPALLPIKALEGVGTALDEVGEELVSLDVAGLLATVNGLAPAVTDAFLEALAAVKAEILALLEAIRYASTSGSASVSVGVGGSIG